MTVLDFARLYAALGYTPIPILPGEKLPAIRWKPFQHTRPTPDQLRHWFSSSTANIALVTGSIVVVDLDVHSPLELYHEFIEPRCGPTPQLCETPRGGLHAYFRARKNVSVGNRVHLKNQAIDIRGQGGYIMVPPSRLADGSAYTWLDPPLPLAKLPVFKVTWMRERTRRLKTVHPSDTDHEASRRARAYIAHIEGAITGQRGHDATMRVAGVLIQKFGLSIDQALPLFLEWNDTCEPPWSEKHLRHKLQAAWNHTPR